MHSLQLCVQDMALGPSAASCALTLLVCQRAAAALAWNTALNAVLWHLCTFMGTHLVGTTTQHAWPCSTPLSAG